MKEIVLRISARIIGTIIGIAVMYGLYKWLGFEITALLYLASVNLMLCDIKDNTKKF